MNQTMDIMFGILNIQYHHFHFRSSNCLSLMAAFMQTVALKAQSHLTSSLGLPE